MTLCCLSLTNICKVLWLIALIEWFGTAEMNRVNSW